MQTVDEAFEALNSDPTGILVLKRNGRVVAGLVTPQNLDRIQRHRNQTEAITRVSRTKPSRKERRLRAAERARNARQQAKARKAQRTREHERNAAKKNGGRMLVPGDSSAMVNQIMRKQYGPIDFMGRMKRG